MRGFLKKSGYWVLGIYIKEMFVEFRGGVRRGKSVIV